MPALGQVAPATFRPNLGMDRLSSHHLQHKMLRGNDLRLKTNHTLSSSFHHPRESRLCQFFCAQNTKITTMHGDRPTLGQVLRKSLVFQRQADITGQTSNRHRLLSAIDSPCGNFYDDELSNTANIQWGQRLMAVPKRKHSNSRTGKRRAHDALRAKALSYCPKCSTAVPTHVVCPTCGYYMGRTVVEQTETK